MTYADVAAAARRLYLSQLDPHRADGPMVDLYRPLAGVYLARWFASEAEAMPPADPVTLAAAERMLRAWCEASETDPTPAPGPTPRAVLRDELCRHWGRR